MVLGPRCGFRRQRELLLNLESLKKNHTSDNSNKMSRKQENGNQFLPLVKCKLKAIKLWI
jgi:hypothetical protein